MEMIPENIAFSVNSSFSISFQPFGEGLVTLTLPQMRRTTENSLSLWNISSPVSSQVNTFVGHSDVVLEFQWRSQMMEGEIVTGRAATEGRGGGGVERRKREGERRGKSKEGRAGWQRDREEGGKERGDKREKGEEWDKKK